MKIALVADAAERVIAFNGSAKPLGERSQADLADLAIMAHESGRQDYLDLFQDVPTLAQLKKAKTDAKLEGAQVPRPAALAGHPGHLPENVPAKPFGPENPDMVNAGTTETSGDTGTTVSTAAATPAATGSAGSSAGAGAGTTSKGVAVVTGLAGRNASIGSIND